MKVKNFCRVFRFNKCKIYRSKVNFHGLAGTRTLAPDYRGWEPMGIWASKLHEGDTYRTSARYFSNFIGYLLGSRPGKPRLWVTIQEDLRRRVLNVNHNNLLVRYRYVFPFNYLRHSYINEALYIAFFFKDLRFLVEYLKRMFRDVNFFKHRFLIYFLRAVFSNFGEARHHLGGSRGLFVKFKGKISQAGNSRKRRFLIGCGQVSTSQAATYEIEKFQIKTFTGAIGCTVILSSE